MDESFEQMSALLRAVWPAVSHIDWSLYCTESVSVYDNEGVPRFTGLLMHRSTGGRIIGASTDAVGFLPRPEKSAATVTNKTTVVLDSIENAIASITRRDPDQNIWGGGVRCSSDAGVAYAISGLPEIGDHLLVAEMMWTNKLLCLDDFKDITGHEFTGVEAACARVGMSNESYQALKVKIDSIVYEAAQTLGLLT
jgi:hypothetical protein